MLDDHLKLLEMLDVDENDTIEAEPRETYAEYVARISDTNFFEEYRMSK